jgi:lysophospholipase L1-like esterase
MIGYVTISAAKKRSRLLAAWLTLAAFSTCAHGQSFPRKDFALKDKDTVVFYGDSITALRLYTRFAEEFVLTRYPALHVRFVNAGVPGDTTYGGYAGTMAERVQRDVAPFHPSMITVMMGMNDGGYVPVSAMIDAIFQKGYRELLAELRKASPQASITLICPSPYDEVTHGTEFPGYSHVLDQNADDISRIAAESALSDGRIALADAHRPLVEALERAKAHVPSLAALIIPDRIHPADTGQWIMAAALLAAWNVDPVVSRLVLNAQSTEVLDKQRTTVTQLEKTTAGLHWNQLDDALPLPLDLNHAMTSVLLKVSNIAELDQQMLRVKGLKAGRYELLIDTKPVGIFSPQELEHGINLALYKTPMHDQARGIDWYEERRAVLDQARFILSAEAKQSSTSNVAEETLRKAQDELDATVRTKLDPLPHKFELRRR